MEFWRLKMSVRHKHPSRVVQKVASPPSSYHRKERVIIAILPLTVIILLTSCSSVVPASSAPASTSSALSTASSAPEPAVSFPEALPSTGRAAQPDTDTAPEQVLETFIDCLRKGDSETLCSLFVDGDKQAVAQEALFAFYGPLTVWDVHISTAEGIDPHAGPPTETEAAMYMTFRSRDTRGEFGITGGGDMDICKFPQLRRVDGVWKILTLGGSSPAV